MGVIEGTERVSNLASATRHVSWVHGKNTARCSVTLCLRSFRTDCVARFLLIQILMVLILMRSWLMSTRISTRAIWMFFA